MNGASLSNSLFLHPHSLYPLRSSSPYIKISIPHRIQAIFTKRNDSFRPLAVKKHTTENSDVINDEDDDDDLDWDEFDEGEEQEEENEDEFLPIEKMNKWLEKKPRGFGQGKKYETTIEDKLLDEIEQSWKAQAANLNKLKNDPLKTKQQKGKDNNDVIKIGFRVRVSNLPKKKNVHRDLKVCFKGVSGILEMVPAVSGNKKTKDPVCKGFGFIDFKSEVDAKRFVEQFNGERLAFGKVVKQIKCQVVEFSSEQSVGEEEIRSDTVFEELPFTGLVEDVVMEESDDSDEEVDEPEVEEAEGNGISSSVESLIELRPDAKTDLRSRKQAVKPESRKHEEIEVSSISFQASKPEEGVAETQLDDDDDDDEKLDRFDVAVVAEKKKTTMPSSEEQRIDRIRRLELKLLGREKSLGGGAVSDQPGSSSSTVEGKKKEKKKKKIIVKGQGKKGSKIEIPGSSKRLKVKEKALLTGVLVKYAAKAASTSNNE